MATKKTTTKTAEDFITDAQKTVTQQAEKLGKDFTEASTIGQDALTKSSEIAAKAVEDLNNEFAVYTKKSFEDGVAAAKDMAQAKSITEFFEKQTAFATQAFEGFFAQATKFSEAASEAAKEASAPLNAQMTAAADKMKSYTA